MADTWKTLWDGEANAFDISTNGYMFSLWNNQTTTGKNTLMPGDFVRVTIDGVVSTYTVQADGTDAVEAGNEWLSVYRTATSYTDDGTDFYFWEYMGCLRGYVRNQGTHHVKFEVAASDPVPVRSPSAMMLGYQVGQAVRRMRGEAHDEVYPYRDSEPL